MNLPEFGKIKIDGEWCEFHESSVITGTISDDYCKIKIEEFKPIKPKMNTYKIISGDTYPTLEKLMTSQLEVKSESLREACCEFMKSQRRHEFFGYFLHVETSDLFYVQYHRALNGQEYICEWHKGKLEKPNETNDKMNLKKLKIMLSMSIPSYENLIIQGLETFAKTITQGVESYVKRIELDALKLKGYTLDLNTLELHEWYYQPDIVLACPRIKVTFLKRLEKPKTKQKPMNNLSFKTLAEANIKRIPLFKNSKGLPAHSKSDGSDWSHAEWLQAVIGELGEYANIMKKVQRGDLTMEEAKPSIEKELADVQIYFSILAQQLNIDLGEAVQNKFNEVSDRVKADVFIKDDVVYSKDEDTKTVSKKKQKFKVMKSIKVKSLLTNNIRYFSNSSSNFKTELQSVPKSILLNHKPYEYSSDCIKVNDLLQFIFDDYSTLSYVVTEIIYKEDDLNEEELRSEFDKLKVKVKKKNLTAQLYHKPVSFSSNQIVNPTKWSNNSDFATNLMVGVCLSYLVNQFISKPVQKFITLQDLNNGKVYTSTFVSGRDSTSLQELSKLVVKDAPVMKTLQNGKDYDGFNVSIGDMIQFSDDRNVLYSLRVTKIE